MRRVIEIGVALIVGFLCFGALLHPSVAAAESIYVRDGGNGEIRVSTPWGEYAVYDEGGGNVWVGTQRDFDRRIFIAEEAAEGNRLSTVNERDAAATFVSSHTYRTNVGDVSLDGIDATIMFSIPKVPARPSIPSSDRYVAVNWFQTSGTGAAYVVLVDPRSKRAILPYGEAIGSDGAPSQAEFAVPRSLLTRKMLMVFVISRKVPGIVPLKSVAWADYQTTSAVIEDLKNNDIHPDASHYEQLRKLRLLDPSLHYEGSVADSVPSAAPDVQHNLLDQENYIFANGSYPFKCSDPGSNAGRAIIVNQGDRFVIPTAPLPSDTWYAVDVRPGTGHVGDPARDEGSCLIDVKKLESMAGPSEQ